MFGTPGCVLPRFDNLALDQFNNFGNRANDRITRIDFVETQQIIQMRDLL